MIGAACLGQLILATRGKNQAWRWWDHFYWEVQIVQICYCLNLKWLWTYWLLVDIIWCRKWNGSKLLILQPLNLLDCSPTAVSNSTQDYFFQFLFELWSLLSCKHTLSNRGSYYSHCMLDYAGYYTSFYPQKALVMFFPYKKTFTRSQRQ